jgi:adenylate cyclase
MDLRFERLRRRFSEAPASVPPEQRRYYFGANLAFPVGLLWHLAFIFVFWAVGAAPLAVLNVASVAAWALALWLQLEGRMAASAVIVVVEVLVHAAACVWVIGWAAGFQFYILILAAAIFFVPMRLAPKLALAALAALAFALLHHLYAEAAPRIVLAPAVLDAMYYGNALSAFFVISLASFTFDRAASSAEATLVGERTRSEEMAALLKRMFGRYLAPEVMNAMIENPTALELGGEKRRVTIMMTDLRGFTALAERLAPEQVVRMLNAYFEVMVEVIVRYHGTINEIIGDALLVLFGAPQDMPDRARRAVACAIEMQNAMAQVNAHNRAEGLPELQMGIGLNDAEVVVGNVGTAQRSKYAAVGGGVNMASRIESFSVGGQVLLSESVREAAGDVLLRIDAQRDVLPKGAETPLRIYQVGGIGGEFNVALEESAPELVAPAVSVPLRYALIEEKASGAARNEAALVRLAKNCAEIAASGPLAPMADLRMTLHGVEGALAAREFYGKVVRAPLAAGAPALVRFTAVPAEVDAYFQALRRGAPA